MGTQLTHDELWQTVRAVDAWLTRQGWAGFDPYDLLGHPYWLWIQRLPSKGLTGGWRRAHLAMAQRAPRALRELFRIRPTVNAKGVGLMAQAYLRLWDVTQEPAWREKAERCLAWLRDHRSLGWRGAGWGYPFDWHAVDLIPHHTPSGVVTVAVGEAFHHYAQTMGDTGSLDMCQAIATFLWEDLGYRAVDAHRICFRYTPRDDYFVHNANVLVATFLLELSATLRQPAWGTLACRAIQWTLDGQRPEGAFPYWSALNRQTVPAERWGWVDHIHMGYLLRCLRRITQAVAWPEAEEALARGAVFYHRALFTAAGVPKETAVRDEPVDIHVCAEAILTGCALAGRDEAWREQAERVAAWTCAHLWNTHGGWFAAASLRGRQVPIAYGRWGQAWMLLALSELIALREGLPCAVSSAR